MNFAHEAQKLAENLWTGPQAYSRVVLETLERALETAYHQGNEDGYEEGYNDARAEFEHSSS